jgi:hypothetical protein
MGEGRLFKGKSPDFFMLNGMLSKYQGEIFIRGRAITP